MIFLYNPTLIGKYLNALFYKCTQHAYNSCKHFCHHTHVAQDHLIANTRVHIRTYAHIDKHTVTYYQGLGFRSSVARLEFV